MCCTRAQIPWGEQFEHGAAHSVFETNLLALTWIKGEPMPDGLVDEILRGLGLERETEVQRRTRMSSGVRMAGSSTRLVSMAAHAEQKRDEESDRA